jgi:hypothetical protein
MAGVKLNAFVLLNLTVDSKPEYVRKAFRRMVLLHHPDKGGAAEVFRDMKQAYEILADDATKRQHWLDTCPFQPGELVFLRGLVAKPILNGMRGSARAWNGQRLVVEIVGYGKISVGPSSVTKANSAPGGAWAWAVAAAPSAKQPAWAAAHAASFASDFQASAAAFQHGQRSASAWGSASTGNVHANAACGQPVTADPSGLVPCAGNAGKGCAQGAWVRASKKVCRVCYASGMWQSAPPPSPPPPPGPQSEGGAQHAGSGQEKYNLTTKHAFDGSKYGQEYLTLRLGQRLKLLAFSAADAEGWLYGEDQATGGRGWFPPGFCFE